MEIKRITKNDPEFPRKLMSNNNIEELYYIGDISLLSENSTVVSLIGRRDVDEAIYSIAKRCGRIFAECGIVTLNGLAIGCDTAGLEGALSIGGKCVAVMPCGLDYIYPKCNVVLVKKILGNGGCMISEYPPGTRPEKWRFVARDKIQAQLSDKILVVDCEEKGGTMYAVREGARLNKDIGCIVRVKIPVISSGNQCMIQDYHADGIKSENALRSFLQANHA